MAGELEGRTAIVTGSTRGIGRALATRFSAEGAQVVVTGRDKQSAAEVAASLPGRAIGVGVDVRSSAAVSAMVVAAVDEWGAVDVLVNNAGVALDNFITRLTDERWQETIDTNLNGSFWGIRSVVPHMKRQGSGVILNVVSWAGLRGNPGQAAYAASKAGQYGLTITAAKELAQFGIRVNALSPATPTEISSHMDPELRRTLIARRPIARDGQMEEVVEGALFLVSDRSSFTTGQVLHVDGGFHLM